jgi:hypothetical protein
MALWIETRLVGFFVWFDVFGHWAGLIALS